MSTFAERFEISLNGRKMAWLSRETGIAGSTLTSYRKGSIPAADAAFRLADALGVDARWLITGHGSPHPAAPEPNRSVADVNRRLDVIEERLHDLADVRADVQTPEFSGLRDELSTLARDEGLPDNVRARADLILRLVYEDAEAEARQERRTRRFRAELKRQQLMLDDAIASVEWTPSLTTRDVLLGVINHYNVDEEGVITLLREMQRISAPSRVRSPQ